MLTFFFVFIFLIASDAFIPNYHQQRRNNDCNNCEPAVCPCKKERNSTSCFVYDTTKFATSLDEALYTFPDVSDPSLNRSTMMKKPASRMGPSVMSIMATSSSTTSKLEPDFSCTSPECRACRQHVMDGFASAINVSLANRMPSQNGTDCAYIKEKELQKASAPKYRGGDSVSEQILNILDKQNRRRRDTNDNSVDGESSVDETELKNELLGVSTEISCDYTRGETLDSGTNWCGLCDLCWTWRKLPSDYFPSYLNEISCSTNNACLAGFGKCRPVLRTLTVLRNFGTQKNEQWIQQSINSVAGCECQVEAGTSLHAFITR